MDNKLDVHPEVRELVSKCNMLRDELAKLISEHSLLMNTTKSNIEALYMKKIGYKKYELMEFECEVARLKRKTALIQASINRSEQINLHEIDEKLDQEFTKWQKELKKYTNRIIDAGKRLDSLLSEEESNDIRKLFRRLVRRLHPDINPDLSDRDKELWLRVMEAYKKGDLNELKALDMIKDDSGEIMEKSSLEKLNELKEGLSQQIIITIKKINGLKKGFPFDIEEKLSDEDWVEAEIEEIDKQIYKATQETGFYQDTINDLLGEKGSARGDYTN